MEGSLSKVGTPPHHNLDIPHSLLGINTQEVGPILTGNGFTSFVVILKLIKTTNSDTFSIIPTFILLLVESI